MPIFATVAALIYQDGQLHINRGDNMDIRKLCGAKRALHFLKLVANISSHFKQYVSVLCVLLFLFFFLHSSSHPPNPLLNSATTSSEVPMNGKAVHSSSPAIKSLLSLLFAFEVELLYNWALRVYRLLRLLHLKFGSAVTPAQTLRRPGGSCLKAYSDEED